MSEKRYIDPAKIDLRLPCGIDDGGEVLLPLSAVRAAIAHTPGEDVVEVVRCKDCVNYCGFEHCKNGICDKDVVSKRAVYPTDFCSRGERKEQA